MATIYVSAVDGNDANSGADWANAKQSVEGALAIATDPTNIIFVDNAGTFTKGSAITWNMPNDGSVAIISVNRGTMAWSAGAKETMSSNTTAFTIGNTASRNQTFFIYGMYIETNNGNSSSNIINFPGSSGRHCYELVNCTLSTPGTGATASINVGQTSQTNPVPYAVFRDCTVIGANTTSTNARIFLFNLVDLTIINLTVQYAGANKTDALFEMNSTGRVEIIDSDLNGFDKSGGMYFDVGSFRGGQIFVKNCKLNGTPSLVSGTWPSNASNITIVNSDSGDTTTVFEYRNRLGTLTESTSIYADDGAEFDSTHYSFQVVTTALCSEYEPFITPWIHRFGSSTSAQTQTIEFVHDSATALDDREIWAAFERVSDASFPQGTLLSVRNAEPFTGTGVDWAAGDATWTGTGGFADENPQKISSGSITPAEKSVLRARIAVAVASKTLYFDPTLRIA